MDEYLKNIAAGYKYLQMGRTEWQLQEDNPPWTSRGWTIRQAPQSIIDTVKDEKSERKAIKTDLNESKA